MKKRMLALLCTVAMAGMSLHCLPSVPAKAAETGKTYYISSKRGDNARAGTSQREAWETLDKLKSVDLQPGDRVLLEKGSVFYGYIHLQDVHGTEEAPIQIGSYGTSESRPVIHANGQGVWHQSYGGAVENQNHRSRGYVSSALLLYDVDFVEVSGLELTNESDDFEFFKGAAVSASEIDTRMDRTGVAGIAKDGGTMEHIYLNDLYIHDVDGNIEDKHMNNGGIQMNVLPPENEAATGIARYHDIKITNCHIKDVSRAGICVGYTYNGSKFDGMAIADETAQTYGHTDVLIEGNYVQNAGNDGIVAMYAYRPLIQRNVADKAGADLETYKPGEHPEFWQPFCAAIWPWKCKDAVFQYNEAFDMVENQDGQPWDVDWSDGTVYQYNYSHNNGGGCIMFCLEEAYQGVFRYNISQNDLRGLIALDNNPKAAIYNNVFYIGKDLSTKLFMDSNPFIPGKDSYTGAADLRNNIFYNESTKKSEEETIVSAGRTFQNNIFYGYEGKTLPEGAITSDPKLKDPGAAPIASSSGKIHEDKAVFDGYTLREGSPAINAGILGERSAKYDFFGNPVGAQPDIGVFESDAKETVLALGGDRVTIENGKITQTPKGMKIKELKEQLVYARDVSIQFMKNGQEAQEEDEVTSDVTVRISRGGETVSYAVEMARNITYADYEPDAQMRASVQTGSEETGASEGAAEYPTPASNALDGNTSTIWHTRWEGTAQSDVWLLIDLGSSKKAARFTYIPRQNNNTGIITKYKIEVSQDGTNWTQAAEGTWSSDVTTKYAFFDEVQTRYVKLTGLESLPMGGGKPAGSAAEVRVGYIKNISDQ